MCQRDSLRAGVAFYVHVMWDPEELHRERSGSCRVINPYGETGSVRPRNIKEFFASNRGMPAMQEHLNGATGRTSIPRCGLPCRRSGSRRRSTRFEEAAADWKSYLLPVEWTRSRLLPPPTRGTNHLSITVTTTRERYQTG
ncbi:LOW QUALITY PROTEIN: uncharacterized protein LOC143425020 [Xylocopa sonorina]|uniref:LOW QUALITY PROTEIN: uncharacterized protein LOC143425020 n=1 Tax=Xylocopa sonorina TaxID=1818115 RepID=UPI00403A8757